MPLKTMLTSCSGRYATACYPSFKETVGKHFVCCLLISTSIGVFQGNFTSFSVDAKEIHFGIEADEFATELEKFISGTISRCQKRSQDFSIEATLGTDWLDNFEGVHLMICIQNEY
jgi:hypothetical protein